MIFRLTTKLAQKVKVGLSEVLPAAEHPLLDWSANVFLDSRVQYVLVTNTTSLYSAIMPGRGVATADAFVEIALEAIGERMLRDGWTEAFRRVLLPARHQIKFSKALSRSVTGSMNDMIVGAKLHFAYDGLTGPDIERQINNCPLSAIGYRLPCEVMREIVEKQSTC